MLRIVVLTSADLGLDLESHSRAVGSWNSTCEIPNFDYFRIAWLYFCKVRIWVWIWNHILGQWAAGIRLAKCLILIIFALPGFTFVKLVKQKSYYCFFPSD